MSNLQERLPYDRLLKIARAMHTWIFLNTADEESVYQKIGLTEEENYLMGYGGKIVLDEKMEGSE